MDNLHIFITPIKKISLKMLLLILLYLDIKKNKQDKIIIVYTMILKNYVKILMVYWHFKKIQIKIMFMLIWKIILMFMLVWLVVKNKYLKMNYLEIKIF
jgi:hypothetical protein